jgi:hypothetical protein
MAAEQFLCSVALYSAWLPCGGDWVVKRSFVNKPSAANRCLQFSFDYAWRGDGTGESLLISDELYAESYSRHIANRPFTLRNERIRHFENFLLPKLSDEFLYLALHLTSNWCLKLRRNHVSPMGR